MDAVVAALVGGVTQLQRLVAGQASGPLFRVRSVLSPWRCIARHPAGHRCIGAAGTLSACPAMSSDCCGPCALSTSAHLCLLVNTCSLDL